MKIGVVTVTFNSSAVIDGFIKSMLCQTHSEFVLFIIDNLSSDDTLMQLSHFHDPRLRLTENGFNAGFAAATNQGIRAALAEDCETVLLINNDTEFGPGLLEELVGGLAQHDCDMTTPKILYFGNPSIIWSAGGKFDRSKGYACVHYGLDQEDTGQFDTPRIVEHAPACCLLVKSAVFEQIGFLDTNFFTYLEDADFCYRTQQASLKLVYLPSAVVFHKAHALTGGDRSPFSMRYITRNRVYFLLKHFGSKAKLLYLPAYQVHLILQFLRGQLSPSLLWLREQALFEGLRLSRRDSKTPA